MRTKSDIIAQLTNPGVIAIIRARKAAQTLPIAEALLAGGVGTVLDAATCQAALAAGAEFVVSPICRPELAQIASSAQRPVMLGAFTPTEAQLAHEAGADFVKIFPADKLGPGY